MNKNLFLIGIVFIILTIAMTYPLIFKVNSCIPGFFSTDESYAVLWNSWLVKTCKVHNLSLQKTDFVAYPFGVVNFAGKPIGVIFFLVNYLLSVLTNPALTYNIQVIANLFLAALLTYMLVSYITKNTLSGLLSGIIFGFSPYIFVRSWQHLGETYLWPMPLFLLSLFKLKDTNKLGAKIFFIFSIILCTINGNMDYYIPVIFGTFLVYCIVDNWQENRSYILRVIFLAILALVILSPEFVPIIKNIISNKHSVPSAQNIYHRPFEDLFAQSARPLSYFLPAVVHPIFGKFTEKFVGTSLYGMSFTEHTLYLGWIPILLAYFAFKNRRKVLKIEQGIEDTGTNKKSDFYLRFFIILAATAWFFSQPPWWKIGPLKIYMPSFFMYKIIPVFRAYCRFGIVVMLSVAVLAGYGLKFIIIKFREKWVRFGIAILLCCGVLFEFWNYPPFKIIDVSHFPAVYYWLKEQPKEIVIAEYPLDLNGPREIYKLFQTLHGKKMINGTVPGTEANTKAKSLKKLSDIQTIMELKQLGVKFIIVHRDNYLKSELRDERDELERISQSVHLKLIKNFSSEDCIKNDLMCIQKIGPVDVYEILIQSKGQN